MDAGYKEVTVLGQNVNSYRVDASGHSVDFAELLYRISQISPELRVRYSTSHPKDCSDALLHVHREVPTVCDFIHLPVQHGNTEVLKRMRRTYTREHYLDLIDRARSIVPGIAFSTDIIAGFCGETDEEHADTLSLMEQVGYDHAFMFAYSERPDTFAARKYEDDVPEAVKKARLTEIIALQNRVSLAKNQKWIGRREVVLVEGTSKRSEEQLRGRTDSNHMVVFDRPEGLAAGDYAEVEITDCSSATLHGTFLGATTLEATKPPCEIPPLASRRSARGLWEHAGCAGTLLADLVGRSTRSREVHAAAGGRDGAHAQIPRRLWRRQKPGPGPPSAASRARRDRAPCGEPRGSAGRAEAWNTTSRGKRIHGRESCRKRAWTARRVRVCAEVEGGDEVLV